MLTALIASLVATGQARNLNVFAAASLRESFTSIAHSYESSHPGLLIKLNFAGSQTLASQINQGAPADVFASAALKNLQEVPFDRSSFSVFVLNKLEIAIRKGLPGIRSVQDLARVPNLVIADPSVPVGRYTESFLQKASRKFGASWLSSVRGHVVSREVDVKAVLAKVRLGEADAGIVYVSDVNSARGQVGEIPIPDEMNEVADYPVAIPSGAGNKDDAKRFIKSLLEDKAQQLFTKDGFTSVTTPVRSLLVTSSKGASSISLPLSAKFKEITVQATDDRKVSSSYAGIPVAALIPPGAKPATTTFTGADRYVQRFSVAELKTRKGILVRGRDGNYQVVVPGLKPSTWVRWLRRIDFR